MREPVEQHGDRDQKAGDGAGCADVEQRVLRLDAIAHENDRPHGAEGGEERHGDEVRQRRVDAVVTGERVVGELVGEEDGEKRDRVGNAVDQSNRLAGVVRGVGCRVENAGDGGNEQHRRHSPFDRGEHGLDVRIGDRPVGIGRADRAGW